MRHDIISTEAVASIDPFWAVVSGAGARSAVVLNHNAVASVTVDPAAAVPYDVIVVYLQSERDLSITGMYIQSRRHVPSRWLRHAGIS